MLFSYRYVHHSIERFQEYLDHLVKEVRCKAHGEFSVDGLHPELRDIVLEIYNTEEDTARGKVGDWLYGPIKRIFDRFRELSEDQRKQIALWYDNNNDIEALCAADPGKAPVTYGEIRAIDAVLEKELKAFCTSLFTDVIGLKAVRARIGEIDEHYREFVAVNVGGKCPYCGFGGIKGPHHTRREAYDHFLPKGTYPFNSVNFRNLAPMCHECNSSYKMSKDPTYHLDPIARTNGGGRRKAFYTYSATAPGIKIAVTLTTSDVTKLEPGEIDLQFAATGRDEELEAWKEVFGIEERYKAKLCGPNDGIAWLVKVLDECDNYGSDPQELIAKERRYATKSPFADSNFLRVPFLEACQTAGVFGGGGD